MTSTMGTTTTTAALPPSVSPVQDVETPPSALQRWGFVVSQRYQHLLDKSTPFLVYRWMVLCAIAIAFSVRFFYLEKGSCIVSFALGIYILRLLLGFLTPQVDDEPTPLPTRMSDEFRPFLRLHSEFKFWYSMTKAFSIAFVFTFFTFFTMLNVDFVCVPLLFYWILAFAIVTKLHIQDMLKYKYNPYSFSFSSRKKQRYNGRPAPSTESTSLLPRD